MLIERSFLSVLQKFVSLEIKTSLCGEKSRIIP